MSRITERLRPLIIGINMRYKTAAGISIAGLPQGTLIYNLAVRDKSEALRSRRVGHHGSEASSRSPQGSQPEPERVKTLTNMLPARV